MENFHKTGIFLPVDLKLAFLNLPELNKPYNRNLSFIFNQLFPHAESMPKNCDFQTAEQFKKVKNIEDIKTL